MDIREEIDSLGEVDVSARSGQQLIHLPGSRHGNLQHAATRVTDEMFIDAEQAVADQVPARLREQGLLYPLQANILESWIQTAARDAKLVFDAYLIESEVVARIENITVLASIGQVTQRKG